MRFHRFQFIHLGCFLTAMIPSPVLSVEDTGGAWIDSHIHLFDPGIEGFPFPPKQWETIHSPHLPETFRNISSKSGIDKGIVIEASPRRIDNDWTLKLIENEPDLLGFVGHLDLKDDDFISELRRLAKHPKFLGFRQRSSQNPPFDRPDVLEKLGAVEKLNLVFEVNLGKYPVAELSKIAKRFPELRIVIDHLGHVNLSAAQDAEFIQERFKGLGRFPNIYCKLSAFYTLSRQKPVPTTYADYKVILEPILEEFGPDRILFGSNWPVSSLHGAYEPLIKIMEDFCEKHPELSTDLIFRENTVRAYFGEKE